VDELVALATDPRTAYVYWELTPLRFARARRSDPEGELVLRVLSVTPGDDGADSSSRDLPLDPLVGDRFVRGLTPGSEVRLCLGWAGPKGFLPLVVAPEMTMPRDYRAELPATLWLDPRQVRLSFAAAAATGGGTATAAVRHQERYLAQVASSERAAIVDVADVPPSRARLRVSLRGGAAVGGASDLVLGGASEILIGGASDLVLAD
jgi:hypothetical protein